MEIPPELARITPVERVATHLQAFLFSAATWNPHRIHYDRDYARSEGHPDVLVQAHLHACFLSQALLRTVGDGARLVRFGWRNRAIACPGQRLLISGRAVSAEPADGGLRLDYELEERHESGAVAADAWAGVVVPWPPGGPEERRTS
ncbi:acyl dehydratase [Actinomadura graeca]|uniref:Acyl dehydratase n=1 Tax=Actinomadura graeca TaxID=2750812 RepID=A0ABX8QSI7_9ACTN|nr:hypothetical protein [Actinomadura graeca]QXJ21154.1 acyl dehydratase [Actinomadura graeca]